MDASGHSIARPALVPAAPGCEQAQTLDAARNKAVMTMAVLKNAFQGDNLRLEKIYASGPNTANDRDST